MRRINPSHFREWTRKAHPQLHYVILSRRCNPGESAFVPEGLDCAIGQNLVLLRADGKRIFPPFLRWLLRGLEWWEQVRKSINVGAFFESLKCADIPNLRLHIPPLPEQYAISQILSALDYRIELNQQINKTLEVIAKSIFKHWFIDFEFPNEEGKPYKSSGGELTYDEQVRKKIPIGWRFDRIGRLLMTKSGGTPSRDNETFWKNGTVAWINSGKLRDFRIVEPAEYITEVARDNSSTTYVPMKTTVIAITGATLGEVSFLEIDSCISQNVVAILASETISSEFIYYWIKHIISDLASWQTGGAQQHINKKIVDDSMLLIPNKQIIEKYSSIARPIFERISLNCFQNLSSTSIRDSLLPKLMSGKRVPVEVS